MESVQLAGKNISSGFIDMGMVVGSLVSGSEGNSKSIYMSKDAKLLYARFHLSWGGGLYEVIFTETHSPEHYDVELSTQGVFLIKKKYWEMKDGITLTNAVHTLYLLLSEAQRATLGSDPPGIGQPDE